MGQYWHVVNLDKREFLSSHKLGAGLKLWEQLASSPGTGGALLVLCAAMPEPRGGGDFDLEDNWHGPERDTDGEHGCCPGPMPTDYPAIARRTIGRWAGDRVALVGDYAKDSDPVGAGLYAAINECDENNCPCLADKLSHWFDVSDDVCAVIEHELGGKFIGEGWRDWVSAEELPKCVKCGVCGGLVQPGRPRCGGCGSVVGAAKGVVNRAN